LLKNKKVLWVTCAVVFIVVLFFIKTQTQYKNELNNEIGLIYGNEKVGDFVNRDTDKDGVLDWEESLWGTDPTKADTDGDGVGDAEEISRWKLESGMGNGLGNGAGENLTETDRLSRELFSTVVALNQIGTINQETADKIGDSLVSQIQNSTPKKVFLFTDIKIGQNNSATVVQSYLNKIGDMNKKHPSNGDVIEILAEFIKDEENPDVGALVKLGPIVKRINAMINELQQIEAPSELAQIHLDLINALERVMENVSDIQFFETDTVLAMSAINQYGENTNVLDAVIIKLSKAISQKLNN